ncbi:MAG: hypothetical protein HY841_15510 [Bacteroidetes bacterium]|nr:hypothetical protein [Bacteroidota bacterium]
MKNLSLIFLFFLFACTLSAQEIATGITPTTKQNDDVQLLYRNEQEFGALLHSAGWGINYRRCKHITGYKKRILEAEIVSMRHPKEIKIEVPDIGTKGYFYGKQFAVTVLRGGYGYHKVITGKSDRRGVELRLLTLVGHSIALAKPVYLNIWHQDLVNPPFGNITTERYDPTNPLHTPNYIIGRAGYFHGFSEMNFFPGGFFKLGLSFEHSNLDDDIKLLELGMTVDAFYKTIPIMANAKNNQVFVNVYLNIMFGKKWF